MEKTGFSKYGWFILCAISFLVFAILLGRVAYIQAAKEVNEQNLDKLGKDIWTKEENLEATRGKILDRNGIEIARDTTTYTMYAILDKGYPFHVKEPVEVAKKLAPILDMNEQELIEKLSKEDVFQVEFGTKGKNLKPSTKNEILALEIDGLMFAPEYTRFYPNGTFASHVIGYTSYSDELDRNVGVMGIEKTYDEVLTGKDGSISYQTDKKGYKLPDPKEQIYLPEDGDNVYLTIDQKIQTFLDEAVSYAYEEYEPKSITAIVADPHTGEILAMTNAPSFDPNVKEIDNYQNYAIEAPFETGSTMKIFTLAAAINEGVWGPNKMFYSGSYKLFPNSKPIRDYNNGEGWGTIPYLEGFQRSSNVLMAKLVNEEIGTEKFKEYLDAFDFDTTTGIDLPNEKAGEILYNWPIEKITTSYGQGTTVTPIQQIKALTAITNGGKMMQPYVVKNVVDSETGEVIEENKPKVVGEPITPETASEVLEIMETVVHSEAGSGKKYAIEGYKIGGKTGTAQIPDPDGGGYMYGYGNYVYSFTGVVPSEDPQFIMFVSVKQPQLELKEWGYELPTDPTAYIFRKVMSNSLFYRKVEQTEIEKVDSVISLEDFVGKSVGEAVTALEEVVDYQVIGNGEKVLSQYPAGDKVVKGSKVFLVTDGESTMPDMRGWALRDVMRLTEILGLQLSSFGSGYVTAQSIEEGEGFSEDGLLIVELAEPEQLEEDNEQNTDEITETDENNESDVNTQ